MKEAIIRKGPKVEIVDSPIPSPGADQVLIRVVVSGSNPKDWKVPELFDMEINQGDDIAGVVEKVGANVTEFKPGDRVAAFHEMSTPHGSYAEYSLAWAHTTFHLPSHTSFEEGAAIPLTAMTSAIALYIHLGLPQPWTPAKDGEKTPLIVYGAASAVGAYAVQLARRSNIHPIICVAGSSAPYVETLIDRSAGDTIIDYRKGNEAVIEGFKSALGPGQTAPYVLDAISENGSHKSIVPVLGRGSRFTFMLPLDSDDIPGGVEAIRTYVGSVHKDNESHRDFGFTYFRYFGRALQERWLKPQRQVVVPGGLGGIQKALEDLKAGRANAVKYVFRIADTEGVEQ